MGTTAEKLQSILDSKADIKDAIEAKGVTVGDATLAEYASKIGEIQQGGGSVPSMDDDVRFFDYEGTLLYSYSKEDFAQLTELPANPSHAGLTAQGWNWTLADAKTFVAAHNQLDIGQTYITDDGDTRLYISLICPMTIPLTLNQSASEGLSINWGDGSAAESLSGTGAKTFSHSYSLAGDYVIRITVVNGTFTTPFTTIVPVGNTTNSAAIASLTKAEIGSGITAINAFAGINNAYGSALHMKSITIPNGVTHIGGETAFRGQNFTGVVIPSTVTSIGTATFADNYGLKVICIPKGLHYASFYYDTSIERATVPVAGNTASFAGCCIKKIDLWFFNGTVLPASSFLNCFSLESVKLPDTITEIGNSAFSTCRALKDINLPTSLTKIGSSAFAYCALLESVSFPSTLVTIDTGAFGSTGMREVTIPDSVTTIGASSFSASKSLTLLTIGSGITTIGNSAFNGCYSLMAIHIKATTPPDLGTTVFTLTTGAKIYVPQGSLSSYQTATNWSAYASYMEEEPTT